MTEVDIIVEEVNNGVRSYGESNDWLSIERTYNNTIHKVIDIVKVKIFNNNKNKQLTWDEIFLFNLDNFKVINYNHMIRLIIDNFVVKNENQPNCKFYYYYQIPIQVKRL